jgi:hypothetical protein
MLIDEVGMMSRLLLDNNVIISIVTGLGGALIIQVGALLLQNKKDKAEAPNKKAEAEKTASEIAIALIDPYREQINDMMGYNDKLSDSVDSLRKALLIKDSEIFGLQTAMESNRQKILCLEGDNDKKSLVITELEKQVGILLEQTDALKDLLDIKDKKILEMQVEINELRSELEEYKKVAELNNIRVERKKRSSKPNSEHE